MVLYGNDGGNVGGNPGKLNCGVGGATGRLYGIVGGAAGRLYCCDGGTDGRPAGRVRGSFGAA